jgi:type IV pilus assembly protein PilE
MYIYPGCHSTSRMKHHVSMMASRRQGFTLIELLVTVTIISILASVALPSYRQSIVRAKRTAAQSQMLDIASREELFLFNNRAYADKAALVASGYVLPNELSAIYSYDVTLGPGAMPSYTITFTATGSQLGDGDLSLTSAGVKSPASKW